MAVKYFDSVQPHGLRVWDQPATGTSVVHQKQKRRKRGRKREAINHITRKYRTFTYLLTTILSWDGYIIAMYS